MKQIAFLSSLILLTTNSFSQTPIDNLISNFKKSLTVKQLKQEFTLIETQKYFVGDEVIEDEFETQKIFANFQHDTFRYFIMAWANNDAVFILDVYKKSNFSRDSIQTPIYRFIDSIKANNYLQKHNEKYISNNTINDFFSFEVGHFGLGCGIVGVIPEAMEECVKVIKDKNVKKLVSLATSIHSTNRAYGIFGLSILKKQGFELSDYQERLIEVNQLSKSMVYNCNGCLYGAETLSSLLSNKKLKNYHDWYKRFNH